MGLTTLLVLFMGPTVLFQLFFTFIYSTFNKKKFSFSKINRSQTDLRVCFMGFASWNFVNFVNLFYFIYILQICVLVCLDRKKNRRTNPLQ